ncbi:MAG: hypothetical protein ACKO63_11090 [Nodosilinea sp.]
MSRKKRNTSKVLDVAQQRALSLEIIDPDIDLGRDVSLEEYRHNIQDLQDTLNRYNRGLSSVDQLQKQVLQKERNLLDMNSRMLAAVAARFGRYSQEYQVIGGTKPGGASLRPSTVTTPRSDA